MKKTFWGVLATVIALSAGTTSALAACPGTGCRYVDSNQDEVCYYAGSFCYADTDGDGICDSCGAYHRNCFTEGEEIFVDADGDGICDNCNAYHWCGSNFADTDGNGICDQYETGYSKGYGHGCGYRNGYRHRAGR